VSHSTPEPPGVLETERLVLRPLTLDDAPFVLELLNDPDWLRFIGDKGVRTAADAERYIREGPQVMYRRFGLGLYLVASRKSGASLGICGLIKRPALVDVDLGFAFLPAYRAQGYAFEAAQATLAYGRDLLGLNRIVAITSQENEASIRLLEKLGLRYERALRLPNDTEEVRLYASST